MGGKIDSLKVSVKETNFFASRVIVLQMSSDLICIISSFFDSQGISFHFYAWYLRHQRIAVFQTFPDAFELFASISTETNIVRNFETINFSIQCFLGFFSTLRGEYCLS